MEDVFASFYTQIFWPFMNKVGDNDLVGFSVRHESPPSNGEYFTHEQKKEDIDWHDILENLKDDFDVAGRLEINVFISKRPESI